MSLDDDVRPRGTVLLPAAGPHREADANGTRQLAARLALSAALLCLGLYVLSNYVRALVWALVLAVALWPLFDRARARGASRARLEITAAAFTLLVGLVFLLPFFILTVEAARDASDVLAYARQAEQSGLAVPAFVAHLPYGADAVGAWWTANLAHPHWAAEIARRLDNTTARDVGRNLGTGAVHRTVLFGFCLLALFFLFRDGARLRDQCLTASEKLFGSRGERVARQMVASVHGTVNGLVLVGIGEGVVLGLVYVVAGVPHPLLLGAVTAVAATIPFAAAIAFCVAALLLLLGGSPVGAACVVVAGLVVTFTADHLVRPGLIGGSTKLPFLWVLLGILGGVESFGLLGLFIGPAIMAALVLLWREFTEAPEPQTRLDA